MELTQERKTELIEATLAWCNERREEQGKPTLAELPKGKKFDTASCPCGVTCGFHVGNLYFARRFQDLIPSQASGTLPELVTEFTRVFDSGGFPELVL